MVINGEDYDHIMIDGEIRSNLTIKKTKTIYKPHPDFDEKVLFMKKIKELMLDTDGNVTPISEKASLWETGCFDINLRVSDC